MIVDSAGTDVEQAALGAGLPTPPVGCAGRGSADPAGRPTEGRPQGRA